MSATQTFATARRHGRIRRRLPVSYGREAPEQDGFAESISEGGLHIPTAEPEKVGTRLILRLEFPHGTIYLRGEVVWAIRAPEGLRDSMVHGMGIGFVDPDPQWRSFFHRWQEGVKS
jgi:hypothetical protein